MSATTSSTSDSCSSEDDSPYPSHPSPATSCGEIVRQEKIVLHRSVSLSFQTSPTTPTTTTKTQRTCARPPLSNLRGESSGKSAGESVDDGRSGGSSHGTSQSSAFSTSSAGESRSRGRVADDRSFSLRIIAGLREKLRAAREKLRLQKEEMKQILEEKLMLKSHLHMNQWNMGQLGPLMRRCSEASVSSAPGCLKESRTPPGLYRARSTSAIRRNRLSSPPRSRHASQKWGIEGRLRRRIWCCASKEVYVRVSTFMRALCIYGDPNRKEMIQFVPIDSKRGIASGSRQVSFDEQRFTFSVNGGGVKGTFVCEDVHDFQRWKTAIKELMNPC